MAAGYRGRSGQEYIYGNTVRAAEPAEADYRRRQKKAADVYKRQEWKQFCLLRLD